MGVNWSKFRFYSVALLAGMFLNINNSFRLQAGIPKDKALLKNRREAAEAWQSQAMELINSYASEALEEAQETLHEAYKEDNAVLKICAYDILGRAYIETNEFDSAIEALDSALLLSTQVANNYLKAELLYRMGLANHYLGKTVEALKLLNDAVQACRYTTNYVTLASSYSIMGTIYRMNGLYDRAIEYILNAELNYQKAEMEEGYAWSAYLLGRTYSDLGLDNEALIYFNKALAIYKRTAAADGVKNGIAICNEQIASLYINDANYSAARALLEENEIIFSENGSQYGKSNTYKSMGILEYTLGNYSEAENNFRAALELRDKTNDLGVPIVFAYLGLLLTERGKTEQGIAEIEKGLKLARENDQKRVQLDIYKKLAEVYQKAGKLNAAIECQMQQIRIQDLILAGGGNIKASQLAAMYEIDQKNAQIAELEKQNEINELSIKQQRITRDIMLAGFVLALLLAGNFYWFYLRLRRSNRKLNEINAAKDKFFSIISHDLRGPTGSLASLLKYVDSNFEQFQQNELRELLSVLTNSADQVSDLLENLLMWARTQTGKIVYKPQKLNLVKSLERAVKDIAAMAHNKEIIVNTKADDEVFVRADSNMLQTILRNLLSNAIKFTPRGGMVNLQYTKNGQNQVNIAVSDSGIGIEKSKIPRIFDITNSDNTPGTENEASSGLGLVLVKDFVEKNQGTITINSQKGKGTTVTFSLQMA